MRFLLFLVGIAITCVADAGSSLPQLGRPTYFAPLGPAIVGTPVGAGSITGTNTTTTGTGSYTVATTGDDLLIILSSEKVTSTVSLSSITTSSGSITTDLAFSPVDISSVYYGTGIYRVHNATSGSITITITWSAATSRWGMILAEITPITVVDGTPSQNTGTGTSITTNSITTTNNGDLVIADVMNATGANLAASWTGGFSSFASYGETTVGMNVSAANYAQPSAGAVSASGTFGSSATWASVIVAYH